MPHSAADYILIAFEVAGVLSVAVFFVWGVKRPVPPVRRYYLGVEVLAELPAVEGWAWATWPDGRRFLHWADQLREEPWP